MYRKGSSLVFSLVVLSFLLISALSVAVVSVTEKRSALSSKNSNVSFQVADSAAETILQEIYKVNDRGVKTLGDVTALAIDIGAECSAGKISGTVGSGRFEATLYSVDTLILSCDARDWRTRVAKIKFQGTYQGTTRAIEVGVHPRADMVGYWKLDETSGAEAADSSGKGNNGSVKRNTSGIWVPGKIGGSMGSGASVNPTYLEVSGSDFNFEKTDKFSGCLWTRNDAAFSGEWSMMSNLSRDAAMTGWEFGQATGHQLQFYLISNDTTGDYIHVLGNSFAGGWHHICFTYDGSGHARGVKLYLDGVESSTTLSDSLTGSTRNSDLPFFIGSRFGDGNYFSGYIDDVRIYNRILTPDEINVIYLGS